MTDAKTNDAINEEYQLRVATNLHANFANCTLKQLDTMVVIANCVLKQLNVEAHDEAKRDIVCFGDTKAGKEYKLVNEYCTMIERRRFYMLDQAPPRNRTERREQFEQVTKPLMVHCEEIARKATK